VFGADTYGHDRTQRGGGAHVAFRSRRDVSAVGWAVALNSAAACPDSTITTTVIVLLAWMDSMTEGTCQSGYSVFDLAEVSAVVAWGDLADPRFDELELAPGRVERIDQIFAAGGVVSAVCGFHDLSFVGAADTRLALQLARSMLRVECDSGFA
jgi:hypothetical protein